MRPPHRCALIVAGLLALLTPAAAADYPSRPITIVVPYTPGGSTDILARLAAQKLEQRLKTQVIVENKPGAGTVIATPTRKVQSALPFDLCHGSLSTFGTTCLIQSAYEDTRV
jgi:tripartite-type tricarboxylate transporter receptor subunit TctC